jgi:hypothetical protein
MVSLVRKNSGCFGFHGAVELQMLRHVANGVAEVAISSTITPSR